ncbi:MAG: protein kinase, partial [archaeon]|nr:protein kinase [archaeon]
KGLIYIGPPTEENLKTITMLQNSTFRRISISGPASLAGGLLCYEGALSTVLILDQVLVTGLSVTLPRENPTPVYVTGGVIYTTGLPTLIFDTVFSNLSISAPSILGAAILIDGATNVSIVRSSFIDINSHGFSCGQDLILNNGGAVFFRIALLITTSAITVRDSIFDANTATCAHGGSLSIGCGHTSTFSASCPTSIVTIEGCSFTRSAAALGGALSIDSSIATVSNCTFADNSALAFQSQGGNGGAIYGNISVIKINSCSFSNNSAILGGAAYFRRNVELVIANSTWDLNAATSLGSALLIESAIQELAAEINASSISSCYFSNHQSMSAVIALNNADKLSPTHLQVVDTKFFNNTGGLAVSGVFGLASNLVALSELNCVANPEALDISALAGLFSISLVRTPLESNSESPCVPGFELLDLPTGNVVAGYPIVGQFLASPICNSSSASFSDSQIMSTYVWADEFAGQGASSKFSNVTVINPSMLEVPIDLVLATEWRLLPRDTFNDVFLPPVDVTIEPGCPTTSTFIVDAGSLELVIPCASAVGVVTMRASDGYHNPISEPQASCPIPNVTLVSTGTPVIYGVTAWNSTVEAYITTYDAYDGGLYYMFVTLENQQINKSPFTVEVIKPSTNTSTLSCIPVANSSFIENTQVLCTLLYDTPTLPYPYCGSSIHCTTVSFLYEGMPDTNISVTDFACVSLNALSFTWLLGSPGDYQVLMEIAGVPMLPVSITAFSTGHSSTSWWHKFGWYTLAVGILLILAVVAVIVAYLHYRRKRLDEGRYTIVGAEFADIPESGKFLLSLVALLDDASITKIPWSEIILPSASVVDQPPQLDFLGDVPATPDPGAGRDPSFASSSSSSSSFSSLPSALPQLLGAGAAGKVWRAKWRELPVAVKRIYVTSSVMDSLDADVADFFVEIKTLSGFDHPNILRFLGVSVISFETSELALVTELMECSLERIIFSKSKYHELTPRNKIQWALDIARGLQYLHLSNPPIIHRDIKPENVLVSSTGVLKLADFGVSTFKPKAAAARNMTVKVGSPNYFAPEVFDSEAYTESCDIYSFGVLLVEIFAGHRAYEHSDVEDLGIAKLLYKVVNEGLRPPLPPDLPQIIRNIITESFSPEPLLRPSSSEIVGRISRLLAHMG